MTPQIKPRIEQLRRGEVPEGYKKTKVGLVPEEWEIKKLSDISDEIKEVAGTGKYETLSISAGIGFVNQANKFGKELSGKQYEKYTVLRKGDFAYNKGNSKKYPQGCVYRLKDRDSAAVPNVFECFRIKEGNKNYIEQVFISGFLNRQLSKKINHGVRDDGLLNLTGEDFYKSYIIIPPLPEQEKIAAILQTEDKVIELQQKKIDELKRLKKGYLSKMFPKKGCNVPEIRFPGFTDPWEQRKLGDIVGIYDGVHQTPNYQNSGVMFLSVENIATLKSSKFISEYDFKRDYKVFPQENDILMTRIGDVGTTNVVTDNGLKAYYVSLALLKYKSTDPYFLSNAIQSDYIQKGLANRTLKTAIPMKINKDEIGKVSVMLPLSATEQQQIGTCFRNLDNLITLHQRKCDEEKQKKKALMQLLLTGIVRVEVKQ